MSLEFVAINGVYIFFKKGIAIIKISPLGIQISCLNWTKRVLVVKHKLLCEI